MLFRSPSQARDKLAQCTTKTTNRATALHLRLRSLAELGSSFVLSATCVRPFLNSRSSRQLIASLPADLYRSLWKFGIFNAVQSTVFDSIYQSDENIVVSAPTGQAPFRTAFRPS
mgnify:CR=1 FL=1